MTSRREFLRLAAGGVVAATLPWGCGSDAPKSEKAAAKDSGNGTKRPTLRIAQWNHLLPNYDLWFDSEYVKRWGEEHHCDVVVDHFPYAQLLTRAEIEVRERQGHDLFAFPIGLPFRFEDAVIDHSEIVAEAQRRVGPLIPHAERTVRNAKTGRYFGFCDYWVLRSAGQLTPSA
ncbi:MAG: hypothetical protein ACRDYF_03730 [Acidimicrobiia bacterium]